MFRDFGTLMICLIRLDLGRLVYYTSAINKYGHRALLPSLPLVIELFRQLYYRIQDLGVRGLSLVKTSLKV